jgi:N-acetylneuraminate lyase
VSFRITGLMAAPFAPLAADGVIAPSLVHAYAARLRRDGVRGVFVNGTTGEGQSLTDDERRILAETWIAEQGPDFPVVIHVGHTCLASAQAHAAHAQRHGAAAIASIAPYFFKPGIAGLIEWLAGLSAAAPELPLYHYHMPALSGSTVRMAELFPAAAGTVPTLAGVKYTHEDLHDFRRTACLDGGRFDCVFGRDEILLAGLAMGATGAVGSTYNYAAPLYQRVIAAFQSGDLTEARRWQDRAQELVDLLVANGGGVAGGKAFLAATGLDLGPCRVPLSRPSLGAAVAAHLHELLALQP